jgi:autotransporter-associated beta strand protein
VTNSVAGRFHLIKSGPGTLRMAAPDYRNSGNTTVVGGRLAVGNASALHYISWTDANIIVTNAILEVESGIVWPGRFTLQANATLTGGGKINTTKTIPSTVHVAPGHAVGKLTTIGLVFSTGSHLDWELGNGTTTAGTDYDLLRVEGNFVLPTGSMTLNLRDAGTRTESINGKSFTVAEWTGTDPASTPAWSYVNLSPETIDASGALLSIDTANNKIVLTGLKDVMPDATLIMIR